MGRRRKQIEGVAEDSIKPQLRSSQSTQARVTDTGHVIGDTYGAQPQIVEPNSIYPPLIDMEGPGVATRLLQIQPELSSDGMVQCRLKSTWLFIEPLLTRDSPSTNIRAEPNACVFEPWSTENHLNNEQSSYHALSYIWGDQHDVRAVKINDKVHMVMRSLWEFLHCARKVPLYTSRLWGIDALCIN
jgi:hypothetical protein